jgi:rubrerythrin
VVIGYISDSSDDVEVVATCSSRCSAVGGIEPSMISISSDSNFDQGLVDSASNHPQYTDDDILLVCPTCGSYYEEDTQCPLC